jgi:predicted phage tail protein
MATPALQQQLPDTGDIIAAGIEFKLELQENNTGYKRVGSTWQALGAQGNGTFITPSNATGYRIVSSKTQVASDSFILENEVTATVSHRLLPSGTTVTENYTTTPIAYTLDGGSLQAITGNFKMESNGISTLGRHTLYYRIDEQLDGLTAGSYVITPPAGWTTTVYALVPANLVISGRTASPYEREYFITLPKDNGGSPWDLRITRLTEDATSAMVQNDLYVSAISEGTEAKLTYANTAVMGLKVDASIFGNNIPSRSCLLKGRIVKVPTNYNPITRAYDESGGYWDGTFKMEWTNNPAWVLYDILTNTRFGGGQFIGEADIDKYDFYDCAKYCDELVPVAGRPTMEPRYTFNYVFANSEDLYSAAKLVASSFHAMYYIVNGVVHLSMDRPKEMVAIFSQANVISANGSTFQYATTAADTTSSVVQVRWNDPANEFKQATVTVEDPDLIEIYGQQIESIAAAGCTSEGQARRMGEWALDTYKNNYLTITFVTGLDGADIALGDVVGIYDPSFANLRMSGRFLQWYADLGGSGFEGLKLDSSIAYNPSDSYTCTITMPNGSTRTRPITPCDEDGVATTSDFSYLLFTTPISEEDGEETGGTMEPTAGSVYGLGSTSLAPRLFMVVGKSEKTGEERFLYEINAVEYDLGKFARIEQGIVTASTPITLEGQAVVWTTSLRSLGWYELLDNGSVNKHLLVSWEPVLDRRVSAYDVYFKEEGNLAYTFAGSTIRPSYDIGNLPTNIVDVKVDAISLTATSRTVVASKHKLWTLQKATCPLLTLATLSTPWLTPTWCSHGMLFWIMTYRGMRYATPH